MAAALLRLLLRFISCLYSVIIALRNLSYSKGWFKTHRAEAPVISIGNITTGGTGKTPLVIWLCSLLQQKNITCGVLTRGYKAKKNRLSDEPAILAKSCPKAKVIINPNRVSGAAQAVTDFAARVLIMDDGFQHRRLARDLDILAVDATCPFGYGKMLPAGLLREPLSALARADAAVITRCDLTTDIELAELEETLRSANPNMIIATSIHAPVCAKSSEPKEISLEDLRSRNIFAFCGIGNPQAFIRTIKKLRLNLVGSKIYNDHHNYTEGDATDIYEEARYLGADLVLTTQKDWIKTAMPTPTKDMLFAYLVIELRFLDGEDKLRALIESVLPGKILQNRD
jgi:tetraacyldisaccharide 4'-kinase